MAEQKRGNIINITSVSGFRPGEGDGIYNIGKAGVIMLTQVLAKQLAQYHIRVNAIAPGMTMTPLSEARLSNQDTRRKWENFIPLGRIAEPKDVAKTALFLASEASRHITGHTMIVDGGQMLQSRHGF